MEFETFLMKIIIIIYLLVKVSSANVIISSAFMFLVSKYLAHSRCYLSDDHLLLAVQPT